MLTAYFGVTQYVIPIMLFCYLLNLSIGTYLGDRINTKIHLQRKLNFIFIATILSTLPILFIPRILNNLGEHFPKLNQKILFFVFDPSRNGFNSNFLTVLLCIIVSLICLLPILFTSMLLPILIKSMPQDRNVAQNFAKIYFIQTIGNTFGSIVTGFIYIDF